MSFYQLAQEINGKRQQKFCHNPIKSPYFYFTRQKTVYYRNRLRLCPGSGGKGLANQFLTLSTTENVVRMEMAGVRLLRKMVEQSML